MRKTIVVSITSFLFACSSNSNNLSLDSGPFSAGSDANSCTVPLADGGIRPRVCFSTPPQVPAEDALGDILENPVSAATDTPDAMVLYAGDLAGASSDLTAIITPTGDSGIADFDPLRFDARDDIGSSDTKPPDGIFVDSLRPVVDLRSESAPSSDSLSACVPQGEYSICGNGTGCCSSVYTNYTGKLPGGTPAFNRWDAVKSEGSSQVYIIDRGFISFPALAILQWNSSCTDPCLYASPPSANGCSKVRQYSDVDFQAILDNGFTISVGGQVPYRPGTSVLVYNGEKYVTEGYGVGRILHKLSPPTLEDKIFPGTAAAREVVVEKSYIDMYRIGSDITDVSQYDAVKACKAATQVLFEYM